RETDADVVADRRRSTGVRADVVPGDGVVGYGVEVLQVAILSVDVGADRRVAGDHVAGTGARPADRVRARTAGDPDTGVVRERGIPGGVRADVVAGDGVPGAGVDLDPRLAVARDHVPHSGRAAADRAAAPEGPHADVVRDRGCSGRIGPDVVPGHGVRARIPLDADARPPRLRHAGPLVAGDDVPRARGRPADRVPAGAGPEHDAVPVPERRRP